MRDETMNDGDERDGLRPISTRTVAVRPSAWTYMFLQQQLGDGDLGMAFVTAFLQRRFGAQASGHGGFGYRVCHGGTASSARAQVGGAIGCEKKERTRVETCYLYVQGNIGVHDTYLHGD